MNRIYFYSLYERLWHWLQALAILGLILTGVELHWPGTAPTLGFARAVSVHNLLGFILLGNALLALFYHLATGEIRQFLPEPAGFPSLAMSQARYYLHGIFRNEPHPFERTPRQKLNPLQKVTYLLILNVLLPLQVLTGILMWGAQRWPGPVDAVGGLKTLAMAHSLGAWLFTAFLIMHLYLTTTGRTPLSHVRAMVVGWEPAEETHAK